MLLQQDIDKLRLQIEKSSEIIICTHKSPDGDAIGSMLAMNNYLKLSSFPAKNIHLVLPDACPEYLSFLLPLDNQILNYQENKEIIDAKFALADLIIAVDFNEPRRLAAMETLFRQSNAFKITIDHHPFCDELCYDLSFVNTNVCAASELVYCVLKKLNISEFNYDIALPIYVGMITDTGSLCYSCNSPQTYSILADLMQFGIDAGEIHNLIYNNFPPERLKLLGYVINKLVINEKNAYAYFTLTKKELDEFNYKNGYLEGVINYALNIFGIKIAASFVERNNAVKISFRSKGNVDVNALAKKYFNGGGHKNAAGADWNGTIDEAVKLFVEVNSVYDCK